MISDCHMHTCFSDDSDTPVEAMADRAIALGMERIYITDHHDIGFPRGEFWLDTVPYLEKLEKVKEDYRGRLDIHIGVELGIQSHLCEEISSYASRYPFDYIIGSVHLVEGKDPDLRDELDMTDEEMYREYFQSTLETVKKVQCFQSLGHLDYIVRYGPNKNKHYSYETYAACIDPILEYLIRHEKCLEVNTAGLKYGLGHPNPEESVLRRYLELGGTLITIGSDAHRPEHIAYDFEKAEDILRSLGFQSYTIFRQRKPVQISL